VSVRAEPLRVQVRKGTLQATLFSSETEPRASVLIAAAMGVTQKYYADFAAWLASQGWTVATFDYRGIGESAPKRLRTCDADITEWAQDDCAAMLHILKSHAPSRPVYVIGHSLGAQIVGLIPNRDLIDGLMIVASGSGYWRITSRAARRGSLLLWFVLVPLLTPLCGYFPGKPLRVVGNLPRRVIEQWRRWCLHPNYLLGTEGPAVRADYAAVRTRMYALSFTDDEMMSAASTDAMLKFYPNAPMERRRLSPMELGLKRIGHFGFFRSKFASTLWPLATRWLDHQVLHGSGLKK
jgi:predicted alpha/beta hydrolase